MLEIFGRVENFDLNEVKWSCSPTTVKLNQVLINESSLSQLVRYSKILFIENWDKPYFPDLSKTKLQNLKIFCAENLRNIDKSMIPDSLLKFSIEKAKNLGESTMGLIRSVNNRSQSYKN